MSTIEELSSGCDQEQGRYRRGEACDDTDALELFRRAILERDDTAWSAVHSSYNPMVLAWCRRASPNSTINSEEVASLAWEKFWRSFGPQKFEGAERIADILSYLKMCAASAVIDWARQQRWDFFLNLPGQEDREGSPVVSGLTNSTQSSIEQTIIECEDRAELWAIVDRRIRIPQERLLLHLRYELGLRSTEIQMRRPDLFPDVAAVYRTTRNLLDRLRRDPQIRESQPGLVASRKAE